MIGWIILCIGWVIGSKSLIRTLALVYHMAGHGFVSRKFHPIFIVPNDPKIGGWGWTTHDGSMDPYDLQVKHVSYKGRFPRSCTKSSQIYKELTTHSLFPRPGSHVPTLEGAGCLDRWMVRIYPHLETNSKHP